MMVKQNLERKPSSPSNKMPNSQADKTDKMKPSESYPRSKKTKKAVVVDKAAAARQKRVDEMKAKPINDEIAQFANRLDTISCDKVVSGCCRLYLRFIHSTPYARKSVDRIP
jgi:hypothetical protein